MTIPSKNHLLFLVFLFLCTSLAYAAPKKETTSPKIENPPKEITITAPKSTLLMSPTVMSINFRNESLEAITKSISKLTGKSFIIGTEDLSRKKITIISQEDVTIEEAYRAFLSALEMNDLTVVPVGKFLKIISSRTAVTQSLNTYAGKYAPTSDEFITRIYHLKYIKAEDIARSLQSISTPRALIPYSPTNSLIVTDTGANINRLIEIVEQLDVKGFEERIDVIKIKYATAKDIADQLNNFYNSKYGGGSSFGGSRFSPLGGGSEGGSGGGGGEVISVIIPDPRTNFIIIKANDEGIVKLRQLIAKLDVRISGGGKIHVYYLQNSQAKNVAATLQKTLGSEGGYASRPSYLGEGAVRTEGEIKLSPDDETNSLVITASLQDFEMVKSVIQKLDIPRRQVFVEAYILEVNVTKSKNIGISYTAGVPSAGKGGLVGGFAGTQPNSLDVILDPAALLAGRSGVLGFVTGGKTKITRADGTTREIPNATALIRAFANDADANLLSAPQLLALDNMESSIEVSEKIPTLGATSLTANGLSQQTINREDIGLSLKIKPQINETSDLVRLELEQKIEDISNRQPPSQIAGQTFASTKRFMKTTVLVRNGDSVVIGGLLRDNVIETANKIPLLGDIPILGWLFKSEGKEIIKTNLVLLLTPTILKEYGDYRKLFDKKLKEREEFIDQNYSAQDKKTTYLNRLSPPKTK